MTLRADIQSERVDRAKSRAGPTDSAREVLYRRYVTLRSDALAPPVQVISGKLSEASWRRWCRDERCDAARKHSACSCVIAVISFLVVWGRTKAIIFRLEIKRRLRGSEKHEGGDEEGKRIGLLCLSPRVITMMLLAGIEENDGGGRRKRR